jgi:Family of unknown function (DUF6448)
MLRLSGILSALLGIITLSSPARAHCDTLNGPVVTDARSALEARDPAVVLHWVRPEDETAVKTAFQHTLEVRALGPEAKVLADRYFFETLVRIHRAGEGAPFTGLSGEDPEPIIAETDRALVSGSTAALEQHLVGAIRAGLGERFASARAAREFRPGDVPAGRAFVATYVPLTHWVEGVFDAAAGEPHGAAVAHPGPTSEGGHETGHLRQTADTHGRAGPERLSWALTGVLAIIALVEGVLLLQRRRPAHV